VRLSDSESSGSYTVSSIGQVRRSDASASLALCHSPITQFRIAKDGSKREIADRRPPPMAWQGISSRWRAPPPGSIAVKGASLSGHAAAETGFCRL
jgi:hypothetical protein